jgi:hypothetical protein
MLGTTSPNLEPLVPNSDGSLPPEGGEHEAIPEDEDRQDRNGGSDPGLEAVRERTPEVAPKKWDIGQFSKGKSGRKALYLESEARRQKFLQLLLTGLRPSEVLAELNIADSTYRQWRKRDQFFAAEVDSIASGARQFKEQDANDWSGFPEFRLKFFKHKTPPHQQLIINALLSAQPGDIVLILVPPEHGKTTLFEDYACWRLSIDPNYRITVGTEAQKLARRIVGRVKNRMEEDGPFPLFARQFGPFIPQRNEGRATRQVWAADYFNVYKRTQSDERDYSMVGIGFGSNIAGSRTDQLHGDDLQSMKTLNQTERMLEVFQQDWLSRPGETGFTTVNGTRVGDGDIYEQMMEAYDGKPFFKVVQLPAIITDPVTHERRPLWEYDPEVPGKQKGYTLEMLDRMREKVGDSAWYRNYMQEPRAKGLGTFTEDSVDRNFNYERKIGQEIPVPGAPIYIGLDPALGGINCLMAVQITGEKLYILEIQEDSGLSRNEQIMDRLEAMIGRMRALGGHVTDVVIEAMNFQRGLARDERLREMSDRYGFGLREHLTGVNKYDADIGVPSMVSTFLKREIDIPYGDDEWTRDVAAQFRNQLLRWRPGIKGNVLRQDQVMALWFVWILWQSRRKTVAEASSAFQSHGLPWQPMQSGLLVPTVGSPFFRG